MDFIFKVKNFTLIEAMLKSIENHNFHMIIQTIYAEKKCSRLPLFIQKVFDLKAKALLKFRTKCEPWPRL